MPFTPSHAVVALPFVRTPLVPAAVAVGAMAPDLPLFLRGPAAGVAPDYDTTHDPRMLPLTLVVALALLLVWRLLLRPAARALAPRSLAERLPESWDAGLRASLRETFPSLPGTLWLLGALALGIASHILWDAFTHEGRAGSDWIPGLDARWGPLAGYKWLQYGSGAFGLVVLAIAGVVWLRRRQARPAPMLLPLPIRALWWASLPVALVVAGVVGVVRYGVPGAAGTDAAHTVPFIAYRVLPPGCAIWAAATLVLCLVVLLRRR